VAHSSQPFTDFCFFCAPSQTCTAEDALPTVAATYPEYNITCPGTTSPRFNIQKISLGVYCGSPLAGGSFWYDDFAFECQPDDGYVFESGRYVCQSFLEHPGGDVDIPISSTAVSTDFRWSNLQNEDCYSFDPSTSAPMQTLDAIDEPTSGASSSSHVTALFIEPMDEPTSGASFSSHVSALVLVTMWFVNRCIF